MRIAPNPPKNASEYSEWLWKQRGVRLSDRTRARYEAIAAKIKSDFEASSYWTDVAGQLVEIDSAYRLRDNYPLLMTIEEPEVVVKPYNSFIEKTFRRNCSDNTQWPEPPPGGWYLPDSCFDRLNDLVRTSFVVKYLDGVTVLGERLEMLADLHDVRGEFTYEARMEGYYAGHVVTRHSIAIPKQNWDTERINANVEIQITTQLQEVIRKLLHRYYESQRKTPSLSTEKGWEWDYGGDEFVANYLGHILHYVEGMIMEIRERQSTGAALGARP